MASNGRSNRWKGPEGLFILYAQKAVMIYMILPGGSSSKWAMGHCNVTISANWLRDCGKYELQDGSGVQLIEPMMVESWYICA